MKTDTEYLRGLADNKNLPSLMRDTLRAAADEIEALRADGARLDWLADKDNPIGEVSLPSVCVMRNVGDMRAAIDEAMRLNPDVWRVVEAAAKEKNNEN